MRGNILFIGGKGFIQVFDCDKLAMIATIDARSWIYKIVPINDDHLLCGGDEILMVLEANDLKVIIKEKTQSWVMDIVRVNK